MTFCPKTFVSVLVFMMLTVTVTIIYTVARARPCTFQTSVLTHYRFNEAIVNEANNLIYADGMDFKRGEYFVNDNGKLRVCLQSYCRNNRKRCGRKCCALQHIVKNEKCAETDRNLTVDASLFIDFYINSSSDETRVRFHRFDGSVESVDDATNRTCEFKRFGSIQPEYLYYNFMRYCVDFSENDIDSTIFYTWVCPTELVHKMDVKTSRLLLPDYLLVFSIACYFLTFCVYILTPDLITRCNRSYNMCMINHIACWAVANCLTIISKIEDNDQNLVEARKLTGYTHYFTFMAGIFWMNLMCYNFWSDFPCKRQMLATHNWRKRLISLSGYAYGVPLLVMIIIYALDTILLNEDSPLKPNFTNRNGCLMKSGEALWIFFYGPVSIILLSNTFFLIDATRTQMFTSTYRTQNNEENTRESKKPVWALPNILIFYLKLGIIGGLLLVIEIISFCFTKNQSGLLGYTSNVISNSHGVFIFIIFVVKEDILKKLKEKFLNCCSNHDNNPESFMMNER